MLAWQTQEFVKIELARDSYTVYLQPKIVAEIAFNEIQVSLEVCERARVAVRPRQAVQAR